MQVVQTPSTLYCAQKSVLFMHWFNLFNVYPPVQTLHTPNESTTWQKSGYLIQIFLVEDK